MKGKPAFPEAGDRKGEIVADAVRGNWVDHHAPPSARPYLRLSRADRPIGTWLLLLPCWWGLALAIIGSGQASLHDGWIAMSCALGAWLMRGAGCTWNDITDREFDAQVARTASRPLPSGQVTVKAAYIWMCVQAGLAFLILLTFPAFAIGLGIAALLPVAVYPFAKRFTWWPQAFLGIAFNWGALLGWAAHTGSLGGAAISLFLCGVFWTLFYDTIYAYQDIEDDTLIGVKSTARLFGAEPRKALIIFTGATVLFLGIALWMSAPSTPLGQIIAAAGVLGFGLHLAGQMRALDVEDTQKCLIIFRSNRNAGFLPLIALVLMIFVEL